MPYAVIEKEMEGLDEAQQNAVVMFIRFLVSQKRSGGGVAGNAGNPHGQGRSTSRGCAQKIPLFGALKGKMKFIAPDFDEPLSDFAEYM